MKNCQNFDKNNFLHPDVSLAPVYIWVWNDVCTRGIIDAQLSEMQNLGIRAFYILAEPKEFRPHSMPTNLEPDYLSKDYFELCAYAVEKAKSRGMRCWIYDEGGWPSGGACGKVMKDHPEFARRTLEVYERSFSAGDVYKKTAPDVMAAFLNDKIIIPDGYRFTSDSTVTEYFAESESTDDTDYPDLMNKDAVEYFIRITHEKYAESLKSELGKTVTAVFTDEPKAPYMPMNKELAERYEELYGEPILPYLPLIAERVKTTQENVHILHRWYDLCSRMFCENFLLTCKKWANSHGMDFTGHMDKDHDPLGCIRGGNNFNLMRALRCMDIPGVDVIWRQLYPENLISQRDDMNAHNGFFPRYASSAAAHNGTKLAMAEIFGVAGPGLTYDIMRYTVGYLAVRGVNVFNLFNFPLGRKGALLAQELPVFTESQVYYRHLNQINRYMERLSYVSALGKRVCETGLYYPVCDFQGEINAEKAAEEFDEIGRALENKTADFDIVDDDVLQHAHGADEGVLRIGSAEYRHIIIPQNSFVPKVTKEALRRFEKGGGKVSYGAAEIPPVIETDGKGLRAMHRKTENEDLFLIFREAGESEDYSINLSSPCGYLLDMMSGEIRRFEAENGVLHLSLAVGETAVILLTDEVFNAEDIEEYKNRFDISGGFLFRKETELKCDENGFYSVVHSGEIVPVSLGSWASRAGDAYSGSCVYENDFSIPDELIGKAGTLDLGEVCFTADVLLNGKHFGTALMPPYRFKVPAGLLDKNNRLQITVVNTSANWYVHTDYFDKWSIKELSPYFEAEKAFAHDFASGGLYGPVKLFTQ